MGANIHWVYYPKIFEKFRRRHPNFLRMRCRRPNLIFQYSVQYRTVDIRKNLATVDRNLGIIHFWGESLEVQTGNKMYIKSTPPRRIKNEGAENLFLRKMEVRKISPGLSEIAKRRSARYRSTVVGATVELKRSYRAGHMTMCDAGSRRTQTAAGVTYVHMAHMSSSR